MKKDKQKKCIECQCSDHFACEDDCSWVPLCSTCFNGFIRKEKIITLLKGINLKKNWEAKGKNLDNREIKFKITNSNKILKYILLKICDEIKKL